MRGSERRSREIFLPESPGAGAWNFTCAACRLLGPPARTTRAERRELWGVAEATVHRLVSASEGRAGERASVGQNSEQAGTLVDLT